jgi:hypothetical protein
MANEMTGLMSQIDSSFKKRGLDTTREGNNVTVQGVKKPDAGAGRGGQGGPTAKELADYERKQNAGIFTEGKKMPPSPREMKKGGMTASKRADGIATKGKTRGTMITMKGGGYAC